MIKRDLEDVRKDLSAEIANFCKDMEFNFEKIDSQILLVHKNLQFEMSRYSY